MTKLIHFYSNMTINVNIIYFFDGLMLLNGM